MNYTPLLSLIFLAFTVHTAMAQSSLLDRFAAKLTPPLHYYCLPTLGSITIDGRLDEADWQRAPHTAEFVDIEGDARPRPIYRTTVQLLWDADYLYVAATLEEPNIVGHLKQRDTIIWKENDFEVFLDPDGDGIDYYEFEVNARNTMMDLLLTHPYRAGGEFIMPWDCPGLKHAVHLEGTLNNPHDTDRFWTVEMAIPIRALRKNFGYRQGMQAGEAWRLNFSRVQWLKAGGPEENWVWSPIGEISMHEPERWGLLHFVDTLPSQTPTALPEAHRYLWALYYAQEQYRAAHGVFATNLAQLISSAELTAWSASLRFALEGTRHQFRLTATEGRTTYAIDQRGHWTVERQ